MAATFFRKCAHNVTQPAAQIGDACLDPSSINTVSSSPNVTQLLADWSRGDARALIELTPLVYKELRKLARSRLRRERSNHTLQATALVGEAYLRLVGQSGVVWRDRSHFFAIAAHLMRCVLVDYARVRGAAKRGGGLVRVSLDEALDVPVRLRDIDLVDLDAALERLAAVDARQARVVELRFFAGLTVEEAAESLSVAPATVHRGWRSAKAFLLLELGRGEGS